MSVTIKKFGDPKKGADYSITAVNDELAINTVREAKNLAPVDEGELKSNINSKNDGKDSKVVESEAPYSIYVEHGTKHTAASPFMAPAIHSEVASSKGANVMLRESIKEMSKVLPKYTGRG